GGGGPPTVANFDGMPGVEIGVAMQNLYSVLKPNYQTMTIDTVWSQTNHDASSSQTGSSVFDFEGDGKAEVIYNDECFVWVYDGATGAVLFTANTQSFTGTEATIVADVDGDGHAEIVMGANGANPTTWHCAHHDDPNGAFPLWAPPPNAPAYRGITVFGDSASSWVGTRTLWNQHSYHVTNVCDPRDSACMPGSTYGEIPATQQKNWQLSWLNNFRQNVQDEGLFDAPDAVLKLDAECSQPVPLTLQIRNQGLAGLPANVEIGIYRLGNPDVLVGTVFTQKQLFPGQTEVINFSVAATDGGVNDTYQARIILDPMNPKFHECREDNNESNAAKPSCVQ
ncbi:MAG: VCBS repeat-containing protein, partial [Myxococcales bacterium]|nr:VCBS repeat-containing protein [Myxococcales bacterium]